LRVSNFANDWIIKSGIAPPKPPTTAKQMVGLTDPNDLFFSIEQDVKRIVLASWDGAKLRDEDKRLFRKHVDLTKG
jgi:hypothetical protein